MPLLHGAAQGIREVVGARGYGFYRPDQDAGAAAEAEVEESEEAEELEGGARRYRLYDYLKAIGVAPEQVKSVHFHANADRIGSLEGAELLKQKDRFKFQFVGGDTGAPLTRWDTDGLKNDFVVHEIRKMTIYVKEASPAIDKEIQRLTSVRTDAVAYGDAVLSLEQRFQRDYLVQRIDEDLFWLRDARFPFTNPAYYFRNGLDPNTYVNVPYAPADQRARAILSSEKKSNNNLTEAWKDNAVVPQAGITAADLGDAQRTQLRDLIALYVGNMDERHAKVKMSDVDRHMAATSFAWIGKTDPAAVFYYLIQSPVILIEFDQQSPANLRHLAKSQALTRDHIHAVVRTPNGNDYGKDLLRQHYAAEHTTSAAAPR